MYQPHFKADFSLSSLPVIKILVPSVTLTCAASELSYCTLYCTVLCPNCPFVLLYFASELDILVFPNWCELGRGHTKVLLTLYIIGLFCSNISSHSRPETLWETLGNITSIKIFICHCKTSIIATCKKNIVTLLITSMDRVVIYLI